MEQLPPEIIDNILSFLPLKDLCNTQETSKVFHVLSDSAQMKKDKMIKKIREFRHNNIKKGLHWAACIGNKELVNFFIEKLPNDIWKTHSISVWGLRGAARGGHKDLVEFFIEKGAHDWYQGLKGAARGGHKDLVLFFIDKIKIDMIPCLLKKDLYYWSHGMMSAAKGGHMDLVDFFIEKGTNDGYYFTVGDWTVGLDWALRKRHRDQAYFFLEKGALVRFFSDPCIPRKTLISHIENCLWPY